jgi:hypothetical protein
VLLTRPVNDVGDNPDQLSILQHALNRTWSEWRTRGRDAPIDLTHYEAIGTMANALDQHAEEAYRELGTDPRRAICETLFVTVEYFPKNVDGDKVEAALTELGFSVRKAATIVTAIPTNAIWFGTPVNIEDVKLVALTLIRGADRAIRPIQDYLVNQRDRPLIQVGADSSVVGDRPLTVEAIRAATHFAR